MQWDSMRKRETEGESKQKTLLDTDKEDRDEETEGGKREIHTPYTEID